MNERKEINLYLFCSVSVIAFWINKACLFTSVFVLLISKLG